MMEATLNLPRAGTGPANRFIKFNPVHNSLLIAGHLEPAYRSAGHVLLDFIQVHLRENESLKVIFRLDKLNMSTTKLLFEAFEAMNGHIHSGKTLNITWICHHTDQDLMELALDLAELYEIELQVMPV